MMGFFDGAAKKSSGIYQEIFLRSPAGMCLLSHPDFEIKLANDSFAKLFGFSRHDLMGKLFVTVWKKSPQRDLFFTKMRTDNEVYDVEDAGFVFSGIVIDNENYLICVRKA